MRKTLAFGAFILFFLTANLVLASETSALSESLPSETDNNNGDVLPKLPEGFRIVAYIRTTWGIPADERPTVRPPGYNNTPGWTATQIKGDYLTDLMLSFAVIDGNDKSQITFGSLSGNHYLWGQIAELKTASPHLRVNLSVGGWNGPHFSDMAFDPVLRAGFVANCVKFLKEKDLDGIDIDWEYPVSGNSQYPSRPEDRQNWVRLLKELREALTELGKETGKYYYLSSAVPMSTNFNVQNDPHLAADYVDSLKIMGYDNAGSWSRPLHHANLYNNSTQTNSTHASVGRYLNQGVPPKKLMLGYPAYGKEWRNVSAGSNASLPGYDQSSYTWGRDVSYHPTIKNYLRPDSGFTRYWDDAAKAPVLYNPTLNGGTFVSYCDKEQLKYLVEYAKEKGLGGVFYWEYANDMEADLLQTVYECSIENPPPPSL